MVWRSPRPVLGSGVGVPACLSPSCATIACDVRSAVPCVRARASTFACVSRPVEASFTRRLSVSREAPFDRPKIISFGTLVACHAQPHCAAATSTVRSACRTRSPFSARSLIRLRSIRRYSSSGMAPLAMLRPDGHGSRLYDLAWASWPRMDRASGGVGPRAAVGGTMFAPAQHTFALTVRRMFQMDARCPRRRWARTALQSQNADVAQLVEHFTRNEGVRGSSPRVGFAVLLGSAAP